LEWARFWPWNIDIARKIIVATPAAEAPPLMTTKRNKKDMNEF